MAGQRDVRRQIAHHVSKLQALGSRSASSASPSPRKASPQAVLREAPADLPVGSVISLAVQAAEALETAHAGHVIHRDLKPANLFLQDSGQLKMCDFGIAVAGDATASIADGSYVLGSPAYMSPEQCDGKQADERSDLYSLGCVIYALLTGQPPFSAGSPLAVMAKHRTEAPVPPGRFAR